VLPSLPSEQLSAFSGYQHVTFVNHKVLSDLQLQWRDPCMSARKPGSEQGKGRVAVDTRLSGICRECLEEQLKCVLCAVRVLFQPVLHAEIPVKMLVLSV